MVTPYLLSRRHHRYIRQEFKVLYLDRSAFRNIKIRKHFYSVKFYESSGFLSTTITHSKKIGKKRSMAYNSLHLKIKKKLLLRCEEIRRRSHEPIPF